MSQQTEYYHVRIEPLVNRADKKNDVELDLTEEQVRKQFVSLYDLGEPVIINVRTVRPDQLERMRITHSEVPASKLLPKVNFRDILVGDPTPRDWQAATRGEDVTKQFLLGPPGSKRATSEESTVQEIERLLSRFPIVALQLQGRPRNRPTLTVDDEYDVQYLLHALLKTLFDDVRAEGYTPSYAGGSSRVDFLLKEEQIVIEAKMASPTLTDKKLGEQLIVDINRYQSSRGYKTLICFIYDPGHNVGNPAGLTRDLGGKHDSLAVRVIVV